MNCMKCGRETAAEQVFCEDCLMEMAKHPVKPGTVVFLPRRTESYYAPRKVSKRKTLSLEDQVKALKKRVKVLILLLLICMGLIIAMAFPTMHYLTDDHLKKGQNYNTVIYTTAPAETLE